MHKPTTSLYPKILGRLHEFSLSMQLCLTTMMFPTKKVQEKAVWICTCKIHLQGRKRIGRKNKFKIHPAQKKNGRVTRNIC